MSENFPVGTPRLPDALHRLFDDTQTLAELINGTETSNAIIQTLVQTIGDSAEEQCTVLQGLFNAMDTFEATNRRSAALTIISNPLFRTMIIERSDDVSQAYLHAIGKQTREGELFDNGPIDILLRTGTAIAPYLAWNTKQWDGLHAAWDALAQQFPHLNQRLHIRSEYEHMHDRRSPDPRRDMRVEAYRDQGLDIPHMAKKERVSNSTIEKIVKRLIMLGRCRRLNTRTDAEQREYDELKPQVERFRNEGLGNKKIAEKLGKDRRLIDRIAGDLIEEEKITPILPVKDTRGDTKE
jgi:hypothetical protein